MLMQKLSVVLFLTLNLLTYLISGEYYSRDMSLGRFPPSHPATLFSTDKAEQISGEGEANKRLVYKYTPSLG